MKLYKSIAFSLAALCVSSIAYTPTAAAFFPFGGIDQLNQVMRFIPWSRADMDTNGDGDVSGPNEGIPITLQVGPNGFTDEEIEEIEEAFDEWANVTTAFAEFHFTSPVVNPLPPTAGAGAFPLIVDGLNVVAWDFDGNLGGAVGVTVFNFVIEEGFLITPDGIIFPVSGAQMIEVDILLEPLFLRSLAPGFPPFTELKGVMVHEIGHLLGLGHTILNNLTFDATFGTFVESEVLGLRDSTGTLRPFGVTPTMLPFVFSTDDGTGDLFDGQGDLAPDDIAGVSFLYPRGSQEKFFTISQEARTQTRPNFPSIPILGGDITAWCDVDNDPLTPRVPFVNTMTGLYQRPTQIFLRGRFQLRGLFKELEAIGRPGLFIPTYTITLNTIPDIFNFPLPFIPQDFDSTHTLRGQDNWPDALYFSAGFPAQVFHETEEIFGVDNFDVGTPLFFDPTRRQVVSANSGKTLAAMLPLDFPMFGDQSDVCPLNLVVPPTIGSQTPGKLRSFRDRVLLPTSLGAFVVDGYYRVGPAATVFLKKHGAVTGALRGLILSIEWSVLRIKSIFLIAAGLCLIGLALRFRRKGMKIAALGLIVLYSSSAQGALIFFTDDQKVDLSESIVQAEVVATEVIPARVGRGIVTTTTFEIRDTVKGKLNKGSQLHLDQPGGRQGILMTVVPELPTFQVGEEVILFFTSNNFSELRMVGGFQGKVRIGFNPTTKQKVVGPVTQMTKDSVKAALQRGEDEEDEAPSSEGNTVSLEDYKKYLRALVKQQKGN